MKELQNTSRFLLTTILVALVASFSFASEGDKDKEKNGTSDNKKSSITELDSNTLDKKYDIPTAKNQVDDTLVYEDWDGQGGGGDDDGRASGAYLGGQGLGGNGNDLKDSYSSAAAQTIDIFRKKYKVEFDVYPNPTVNELHIKPEHTPQSIQVTSMTGKVHQQGDYTPVLYVADLTPGTYFIQLIFADRHIESRKFIKY